QLKQVGRDDLAAFIMEQAEKAVAEVDLSKGKPYLSDDWGKQSLCEWLQLKFQIGMELQQIADMNREPLKGLILDAVRKLYQQKEIEFPVTVAMARFMSEATRQMNAGARYDREGLLRWYQGRYGTVEPHIPEEAFRTEPRHKLHEMLMEVSRKS